MLLIWQAATLVVLALVAWAAAAGSEDPALGEGDAGKTVTLRPGQSMTISLPGNPTTGYAWQRDGGDESVVKQVGDWTFQPGGSAIGAAGGFVLRFQGGAAGETELKLAYRRPWEKNTPPARSFEVRVVVRQA